MAKVVIANDHAAIEIKERIQKHLVFRGFDVHNLGIDAVESVDYPDKAREAAEEFLKGGYDFGVLCCGTGIGISISANKVKGIFCALPQNAFAAQMAKEHNNANFIAFGGRIDYPQTVEAMLDAYIDSHYLGDRHQRRVEKMHILDGNC
ncbi:MAG: RpiB/LacA/LacB family sugar-phosphate isomerase [Spirochaetales bacterium]|nr:RpiB/LacA/LacB family sugar-phosphate isomerase [Spirochaetales bacterium]